MNPRSFPWTARLAALCRGDARAISTWLEEPGLGWMLCCCAVITVGCGLYGATLGILRSPLQALYSAIKFPLLIFLTVGANALLNGMLARVMGVSLTFRQTSLCILMSFTVAALLLGALSPISLYVVSETPSLTTSDPIGAHHFTQVMHVLAIAYAGILANTRLHQLLVHLTGDRIQARKVLFAWMAGNLLLGSQLAWILRPFIGSPFLETEFYRDDAMQGNFFESVWSAMSPLFQ